MSNVLELREQIRKLEEQLYQIAPFLQTEHMANKAFGEWSEEYILSQVPSWKKARGMGRDIYSEKFGVIEVKSTRNPDKFTFNQIKPQYSDYHLFITYDLEKGAINIFFVPNTDFIHFSMSKQHNYDGEANCFTLSSTIANKRLLENYRVSWEDLNG